MYCFTSINYTNIFFTLEIKEIIDRWNIEQFSTIVHQFIISIKDLIEIC